MCELGQDDRQWYSDTDAALRKESAAAQRDLDQQILKLSTAAIAFSIGLVTFMKSAKLEVDMKALVWTWVLFIMSIVTVLIGFKLSTEFLLEQAQFLDWEEQKNTTPRDALRRYDEVGPGRWQRGLIAILNFVALMFFLGGLVALMFVIA